MLDIMMSIQCYRHIFSTNVTVVSDNARTRTDVIFIAIHYVNDHIFVKSRKHFLSRSWRPYYGILHLKMTIINIHEFCFDDASVFFDNGIADCQLEPQVKKEDSSLQAG